MRTSSGLFSGSIMIYLLTAFSTGELPNPRIVEHPQDDYAAKEEPAKLNCKAEGSPPPVIQWYHNGKLVITSKTDPSSHKMLLLGGELFFLQVIHNKNNKPDIGVYYCNATNIHGSAISRNATLKISVLRDDFKESPEDTIVAIGEMALLKCRPPKGEPDPRVKWRKNGGPLVTDSRIIVEDNGDLVISSVKKVDAGDYTCVAMNKAGERESAVAKLSVFEKPRILTSPKDKVVEKSKSVELECHASGDPKPVITWRREEGRLPENRAHLLKNGTLLIEDTEARDDGLYICQAENSVGVTEAVAKLTVHAHPSFVIAPSDKTVGLDRTLALQCVATGNPPPTIYWSKGSEQDLMFPNQDSGRFSVDEDGTLRIRQIRFEDAGDYICHAYSAAGSADVRVHIEVRDNDLRPPPIILIGPQNQTLPANSVAMLQCEAAGKPQPSVHWLRNGRPIQMNNPRIMMLGSGTLQISDIQISDTAIYTCRAVSETGETSWSASLVVPNPKNPSVRYHRAPIKSTFPGPPSKPVVTDVTDVSAHLSWRPNKHEGASSVYGFIVELFSPQTGKGWIIASESVIRESFTVHDLKPNRNYMFLIRARNFHGISAPSEMSDMIETMSRKDASGGGLGSRHFTQEEIEARLRGIVVELVQGEAAGSSSIRLHWKVLKGHNAIDGFKIKYRRIWNLRRPSYGDTVTLEINNPKANTFILENLRSHSWYEICILAFGGKVNSQCSNPMKLHTDEGAPAVPPENVVIHWKSDSSLYLRWSPPPQQHRHGEITGYIIRCRGEDERDNCTVATNATTFSIIIDRLNPSSTYMLQIAAQTSKGTGTWSKQFIMAPEQTSIMKEPWFIGMLIGTIGGTLWIALCIFSIWLCRKRRTQKKLEQNGMYSTALQKQDERGRNANILSTEMTMTHKEPNVTGTEPPLKSYYRHEKEIGNIQPDLTNILDNREMKDQNLYNRISMNVPQMKTFYQKPNPVPAVAPYATTTLINTNLLGKPLQLTCADLRRAIAVAPASSVYSVDTYLGPQSAFRPINQGYIHQGGSGSSDSCLKPDLPSSDTDNSRPNTDILMDHSDAVASPGSDSGSYTADETGIPIKRGRRQYKQMSTVGKQPMVNWADLLPPPPEHPPPSDMGSPSDSPLNTLHHHDPSPNRHQQNSSPISPVSKISACSCPLQHDRAPLSVRNVTYSDTEQSKFRDSRPYSPKTMNELRTQRCDMRSYSPRTANYVQPLGGIDHQVYGTRCCHNDHEPGPCQALKGYRLPSGEGECRYITNPERGPTPPVRMHSTNMIDPSEGPLMDRACQSSLPSLANECMQSPLYPARLEVTASGQHLNIDFEGYSHNPDSPVSEEVPDYAGESDLDMHHPECCTPESSLGGDVDGSVTASMLASWASVTDNSNTSCSSIRSSAASSSDGSFLTEADFASAVAKAAELSGLTVVGTTVCDPKAAKKHYSRRHHRAARPTSPYSTDSNFSAVVHKPYPKSQRKKQLMEQGKRHQSSSKQVPSAPPMIPDNSFVGELNQLESQTNPPFTSSVADLPAYNKPTFPTPSNPATSPSGTCQSSSSGKRKIGVNPLSPNSSSEHSECVSSSMQPLKDDEQAPAV